MNFQEEVNKYNTSVQKLLSPLLSIIRVVTNSKMRSLAIELTYSTLLAIVPLLAIVFTFAKSFNLSSILREELRHLFMPLGQSGKDVLQHLFQFIDNAQPGVLGPIGVLFLFYTAFGLIHKVEKSLNQIWEVSESRRFMRKITRYSGSLVYVILLAMLVVTLKVSIWQDAITVISNKYTWVNPALIAFTARIVTITSTALLLAILYSSFPNIRVKPFAALLGGLFTTLTWMPLTWIFTQTVSVSANYSAIYSSFAGLVITLIWLQYIWILFLSGAVFSYLVQHPIMMQAQSYKPLNPTQLEHYAQQVIGLLINQFETGQGGLTISSLMQASKLSKSQLNSVLAPFIRKRMIRELNNGEGEFILNTSIHNLTNNAILETIRGQL